MFLIKTILGKLKDTGIALYSLIGIIGIVTMLWIRHKFDKLQQAKEMLRVKDFVIEEQDKIIEFQKKQSEKVSDVKEFYDDLRNNLNNDPE